jgi:2-dehydro-3-deoxygluconokinase
MAMRVVTLGEVMLRLCPEDFLRLPQALPGRLEATFGGGEVNVAVSVVQQGGQAAFATALPDNPLTDAFQAELRKFGVDGSLVRRTKGRFGIYFVETGANQRGGTVTYDRAGSSIAQATPADFDWNSVFAGATWFHITGITPALTAQSAELALAAVREARARKVPISVDLNFRKKLWTWEPGTSSVQLARRVMTELVGLVDVVIANEEDADLTLGIKAAETDVEAGHLNLVGYEQVARDIAAKFPTVSRVAITLRESYSASHNNWGALLFDRAADRAVFAPLDASGTYSPYEIRNIVDRVGAGDSFAGGLIFALQTPELSAPESALAYAVAASCLKHSIKGDFNYATRPEIEALVQGGGSGRVSR